ncbi:MAG TPA: cell division protein FtsZ, partial [Acidimicrobiia bacterium]|nr:cell division protein FtsZ [Acidimicrobiia bacterium]
ADIIFGAVVDDDLGEEMKVTVIAAGFDTRRRRPSSGVRSEFGDDNVEIPSFVQG